MDNTEVYKVKKFKLIEKCVVKNNFSTTKTEMSKFSSLVLTVSQ